MALWRRFGARSPSVLPAERITMPMRLRKSAQAPRRQPRSPSPASPGNPSGSPQRNGQTRSKPAKADNRADITRTHYWRSRPGGTGTQDTESRPVWRKAANSRRDRTQNAAIGTRDRLEMNVRHSDRNARHSDRNVRHSDRNVRHSDRNARHSDRNARRRPIAGTHSNGEQNACGRQLPHGGGLARRS